MELVCGSTLSTPQPLETALDYAAQIAEALEIAHERGITHRDLKPANIMVGPGGSVKILDFGLATVPSRDAGDGDPANSPTFTMAATRAGIIMGTAGYMSPEQAAGKAVDRRSDIWSFGVVLWEMLTGARLFEGETVSHTIADVLRAPIDFGKLPPSTPAAITELIRRCLDRNIKTRLQWIGEARVVIEKWRKDPAAAVTAAPAWSTPVPRGCGSPWSLAAAFAMAAAVLGVMAYRGRESAPQRMLQASVMPPEKAAFLGQSIPAFSPDGRKLAFVALQEGKISLWVRELDSAGARSITGTEGAIDPFWSPDSLSIAFHAGGKLKRVDVGGGPVIPSVRPTATSTAAPGLPAASLSSRMRPQVLYTRLRGRRRSRSGYYARRCGGEISHRLPWFLPDGRHFLYTARNQNSGAKSGVYVGDLDSKDRRLVLQAEAHATYVAAGSFLVYVAAATADGPAMAQHSTSRLCERPESRFRSRPR